jgi:hypothetical protein
MVTEVATVEPEVFDRSSGIEHAAESSIAQIEPYPPAEILIRRRDPWMARHSYLLPRSIVQAMSATISGPGWFGSWPAGHLSRSLRRMRFDETQFNAG